LAAGRVSIFYDRHTARSEIVALTKLLSC
jgi:hypothetical protein